MNKIKRCDAIRWLSHHKLNNLTLEERESILLNWWYINEEDFEYFILSDEIKFEMKNMDVPLEPELPKYNSLILEIVLSNRFPIIES